MAGKTKSDLVDFLSDGRVKIVFGGVEWLLRRPTIGEIKEFNKALVAMASDQQDALDSKDYKSLDIDGAFSATLAWWSDVIITLKDEEALPPPDDTDNYPMWLMAPDLLVKIQTHWREVPWGSGGK